MKCKIGRVGPVTTVKGYGGRRHLVLLIFQLGTKWRPVATLAPTGNQTISPHTYILQSNLFPD